MPIRSDCRLHAAAALAAAVAAWPARAGAGESCLQENGAGVCLELHAPAEAAPSPRSGPSSHVQYEAVLSNPGRDSARFVELRMNLSPGTGFASLDAPKAASCSIFASQVVCSVGRLAAGESVRIRAAAHAPAAAGGATPAALVNDAVLGCGGRTATARRSVTIAH